MLLFLNNQEHTGLQKPNFTIVIFLTVNLSYCWLIYSHLLVVIWVAGWAFNGFYSRSLKTEDGRALRRTAVAWLRFPILALNKPLDSIAASFPGSLPELPIWIPPLH